MPNNKMLLAGKKKQVKLFKDKVAKSKSLPACSNNVVVSSFIRYYPDCDTHYNLTAQDMSDASSQTEV